MKINIIVCFDFRKKPHQFGGVAQVKVGIMYCDQLFSAYQKMQSIVPEYARKTVADQHISRGVKIIVESNIFNEHFPSNDLKDSSDKIDTSEKTRYIKSCSTGLRLISEGSCT